MMPGPFGNKLSGARACGAGVEKSSLTSGRCANPKRAVAIVGLGFGASIRASDLRAHQLLLYRARKYTRARPMQSASTLDRAWFLNVFPPGWLCGLDKSLVSSPGSNVQQAHRR